MNIYIEAHFKLESAGEYKTVEVMINEDLIPSVVHTFLTARYGKIINLSFHFTREAEDSAIKEKQPTRRTLLLSCTALPMLFQAKKRQNA